MFQIFWNSSLLFHPIQVGGEEKSPPSTSFYLVTSTHVGVSPKNFLTCSFNIFAILVYIFRVIPSAKPKLLRKKKIVFSGQILINPYTFILGMPGVANFANIIRIATMFIKTTF